MQGNQALWEQGDFTRIAPSLRESGRALVESLGIVKGLDVLDLGCGDGTTAVPAAELGANVLGVDIARYLVEAGNARVKQRGLTNCRFEVGDASDLHGIKSQSFDLVISVFGAMFAPRPFDVAGEMVRVTRPGGRIVMGNWIPGDPTLVSELLRICSLYLPPPPDDSVSPMLWGVEAEVTERFRRAGVLDDRISCQRETYALIYPGTPQQYLQEFRFFYAPTMNAYRAAAATGKEVDLHHELEDLFLAHNLSESEDSTLIRAGFLKVVVEVC